MNVNDVVHNIGQKGGIFVLYSHVIGVDEQEDAGMRDLPYHAPALADGVDDIGFAAVQMLDREGEVVPLGDRAERKLQSPQLDPGGVVWKARGERFARRNCSKTTTAVPRRASRGGERPLGVPERGRRIGGGPSEADFRRKEIVARLACDPGAA